MESSRRILKDYKLMIERTLGKTGSMRECTREILISNHILRRKIDSINIYFVTKFHVALTCTCMVETRFNRGLPSAS